MVHTYKGYEISLTSCSLNSDIENQIRPSVDFGGIQDSDRRPMGTSTDPGDNIAGRVPYLPSRLVPRGRKQVRKRRLQTYRSLRSRTALCFGR
jgi:hypothetical protein